MNDIMLEKWAEGFDKMCADNGIDAVKLLKTAAGLSAEAAEVTKTSAGGDGTGPAGAGPMTGRGLGPCNGYPVAPARGVRRAGGGGRGRYSSAEITAALSRLQAKDKPKAAPKKEPDKDKKKKS